MLEMLVCLTEQRPSVQFLKEASIRIGGIAIIIVAVSPT